MIGPPDQPHRFKTPPHYLDHGLCRFRSFSQSRIYEVKVRRFSIQDPILCINSIRGFALHLELIELSGAVAIRVPSYLAHRDRDRPDLNESHLA